MAKLVERTNNTPLLQQMNESVLGEAGKEKLAGLKLLVEFLEDKERGPFNDALVVRNPFAEVLGQVTRRIVLQATEAQTSVGNGEIAILAENPEQEDGLIRRGESFIIEHDKRKLRIGLPGEAPRTHYEFTIYSKIRETVYIAQRRLPSRRGYMDPIVVMQKLHEIAQRPDFS